jgi:hypothetical protein
MVDRTSPPPPLPRQPSLHDESPQATLERIARQARALAEGHDSVLVDHGERLEALEQLVGRAPTALPGDRGSGLAQHLVDLTAAVKGLQESVEADRKQRAVEAERLAQVRAPWSRAWWIVAGAVLAVVAGAGASGAVHWLATLHH